jgi:hypothetical protein
VDVPDEALLVGDALEKCGEVLAILVGEGGEQGALMFAGDIADGGEGLLSFFREDELMTATVAGADAALGEAECLELIEQSDEAAGDHAQPVGQRLLGKAGRGINQVQNAGMGRDEPEPREPFGETPRGVAPELGEQKGRPE